MFLFPVCAVHVFYYFSGFVCVCVYIHITILIIICHANMIWTLFHVISVLHAGGLH